MTKKFFIIATTATALILSCMSLFAANPIPPPAARDKCPVCGMFVGGYQNWLTAIRLKNGAITYFDGPKDMFTFYLNLGKYAPKIRQSDITEIMVKDYYTIKPIDARKAYFVTGSNVMGPMGKELVPFAQKSEAKEFSVDHKGQKILGFTEITPATLKSLE